MALATPWKDCRPSTCRHLLHPLLAHEETLTLICALFWALVEFRGKVFTGPGSLCLNTQTHQVHSTVTSKLVWDALWVSAFSTQDGKWETSLLAEDFPTWCPGPTQQGFPPWSRGGWWCRWRAGRKASHQHLDAPDFSLQLPCCPWWRILSPPGVRNCSYPLSCMTSSMALCSISGSGSLFHSALWKSKPNPLPLILLAFKNKKSVLWFWFYACHDFKKIKTVRQWKSLSLCLPSPCSCECRDPGLGELRGNTGPFLERKTSA